jgi:hypothetical protein
VKACGGSTCICIYIYVFVQVLLLLTSALEGVEWSPSDMAALFPGEEYSVPIEQEAGPHIQSGCFGKEKNL